MLLRNTSVVLGMLLNISLLNPGHAQRHAHMPSVFGDAYQPVKPVVKELTQVVWYRANAQEGAGGAANVYVDGRYHTSLIAGGFTSFCLKPGTHTLGAYVNDSPTYTGKRQDRFAADLQGGTTYFLRVNEQQQIKEPPSAVQRWVGEHELAAQALKRQIHARSRALSVVPCVYDLAVAQPQSHYVFSNRMLFDSRLPGVIALSDQGRAALSDLVVTLRQHHPLLHEVVIQINRNDRSPRQTSERAAAIRNALSLAAIPLERIRVQTAFCDQACFDSGRNIEILVK